MEISRPKTYVLVRFMLCPVDVVDKAFTKNGYVNMSDIWKFSNPADAFKALDNLKETQLKFEMKNKHKVSNYLVGESWWIVNNTMCELHVV